MTTYDSDSRTALSIERKPTMTRIMLVSLDTLM